MSEASLFFKTSLVDGLFTPTPEGKLFRRPSKWMFGPTREYCLDDEQAKQLVADLRRGQMITMAVTAVILFVAVGTIIPILIALEARPSEWILAHPVVYGGVVGLCTIVLVGIGKVIGNQVCFSRLDTLPSKKVPVWRLGGLKQLKGIASLWVMLPNWLLILFTAIFAISFIHSAVVAEYFQTVIFLPLAASAVTALICRMRAQRLDTGRKHNPPPNTSERHQ